MPASSTHAIQLLLVAATITLAAATNYIRGGGLDADARKSRQLNLFKEDRIIGGSRVSLEFCIAILRPIDEEGSNQRHAPVRFRLRKTAIPTLLACRIVVVTSVVDH